MPQYLASACDKQPDRQPAGKVIRGMTALEPGGLADRKLQHGQPQPCKTMHFDRAAAAAKIAQSSAVQSRAAKCGGVTSLWY